LIKDGQKDAAKEGAGSARATRRPFFRPSRGGEPDENTLSSRASGRVSARKD
jgi:hypothetical protein